MGPMTEYTPRMRALDRIARSISEHQSVRRTDGPFSTCKNRDCQEPVFFNIRARYEHQAVVLVNDLQRELDLCLADARDDAKEDGRELTPAEEADIRSDFLILAPAPDNAADATLAYEKRNAGAEALLNAASDAGMRELGGETLDTRSFLMGHARHILATGAPKALDGKDPRLAPAVEAFRQVLARHGSLSSINFIEDAMAAALMTADKVEVSK